MLSSWIFWLVILSIAVGFGLFLTWLERRSSRKLFLGQPSFYPAELVTALKEYFKTQNSIKAAYLAQVFNGADEVPPHPVIGIETGDEFDSIQAECGRLTGGLLDPGESIDFMPLGDDEVSSYMKQHTEPFYKKNE
jgi:hypothetical protein